MSDLIERLRQATTNGACTPFNDNRLFIDAVSALEAAEREREAMQPWTVKQAQQIVTCRNALIAKDLDEAWHQLYWLVSDKAADIYDSWAEVDALATLPRDEPPAKEGL